MVVPFEINFLTSTFLHIIFISNKTCSTPNADAVAQAKRNIAKHYTIVGVSEQLEEFFEVLEWMFPMHFSGVLEKYQKSSKLNWNLLTTIVEISDSEIVQLLPQ